MYHRSTTIAYICLVYIICCCLFLSSTSGEGVINRPTLRVGIIGGGISGAATSHWIRSYLGKQYDLRITLYEAEDRIGGRVQDVHIGKERFENGGSILHESNLYAKYFVRLLNLTLERPPRKLDKAMSIWNGEKFILELSGSTLWDAWTIFSRYGFSFFSLQARIKTVADKFTSIYTKQDHGISFPGPKELLQNMGLWNMTQQSFREWSKDKVDSSLILDELAVASTRVNYGQSLDGINALAGAVGLIPLTDSRLFAVKEGNMKIVEGLLAYNEVQVKRSHRVFEVEKITTRLKDAPTITEYRLHSNTGGFKAGKNSTRKFDVVVLAAPLSEITPALHFKLPDHETVPLRGEPRKEWKDQPISHVKTFQTTHTTWITGLLRPERFGLPPDAHSKLPSMILTTEDEQGKKAPEFTSITAYAESPGGLKIYKVFSRKKFDEEVVRKYFDRVERNDVRRTAWKAYPQYSPPEVFAPKFRLYEGEEIWHPLALEHGASCIEMQIVSARNTAMQIAAHWKAEARIGAPALRARPIHEEL